MSCRYVKIVWAGLLGLAILTSWGCGQKEEANLAEEKQTDKILVDVVDVQPTTIRDILILPGAAEPWMDVTVASDLGGVVESVEFKEGDSVKKDDLVAKIDVAALKAALDMAKADLDLAQRLYTRRQQLYDRQIISKEELDQARTNLEVKKNTVDQAQVHYDNGFIHSPLDGAINKVYVDTGEFVGSGNPVMDIVNIDRLEIEINVPELDVRYLEVGQKTLVRMDAFPETTAFGEITFVAYKADPMTRTFRTKVVLDNANGTVRPGMIGRVALIRRTLVDALTAPLFAVVDKEGERLIFVEENGVARSRIIEYGVIEGDRIQITKGLKPGDHLIVTGQKSVEDGTPVEATLKTSVDTSSIMPGWLPGGDIMPGETGLPSEPESAADQAGGEATGEKAQQ